VATCAAFSAGLLLPYIPTGLLRRGTLGRTFEIDPDRFDGSDGCSPACKPNAVHLPPEQVTGFTRLSLWKDELTKWIGSIISVLVQTRKLFKTCRRSRFNRSQSRCRKPTGAS